MKNELQTTVKKHNQKIRESLGAWAQALDMQLEHLAKLDGKKYFVQSITSKGPRGEIKIVFRQLKNGQLIGPEQALYFCNELGFSGKSYHCDGQI